MVVPGKSIEPPRISVSAFTWPSDEHDANHNRHCDGHHLPAQIIPP